MATTYPTSKQTFTNPAPGNPLNSPSHAQLHDDSQDTIAALEDAVGYTGSFKFFLTTATIGAANGGTGNTSLTAHAVLLGEGTSAVGFATIGTAGRMLLDQGAGADPAFTAMSGDATITSGGVLTVAKIGGTAFFLPVSAGNGGTGLATLTAHAVMLGEGTGNVAFATTGTAGQLLIDQGSGADPAFKAVSGSGATITLSSAGLLTISAIANASLANSSVTVNPGTGLQGGGTVALGGTITLTNPYGLFGSWLN